MWQYRRAENSSKREKNNQIRYKSLCIEIQRMWNMKCMIIPIIIGGTGNVTDCLKK